MRAIVRPSTDLINHYDEISRQCHENRIPTIITVNGRYDTLILDYQDYCQITSELELLRNLAEAEENARERKAAPIKETFAAIHTALEKKSTYKKYSIIKKQN